MKTVVIKLENGGYYNGIDEYGVLRNPHPLNIEYFTYSDTWYNNDKLNSVTDELDNRGIDYKVLEFKYETYEL